MIGAVEAMQTARYDKIMLAVALRLILAKNARMGHPLPLMGKEKQSAGKPGPPAAGRADGAR